MMIRSQRARDDAEREERLAPPNEMRGSRMAGEESLTYDAATRSVEAVFSTGAAVKRWGFIEELEVSTEAIDLGRVEKGLCRLLDTHNAYELDAVLGSVSEVRIENGELVGKLTFAETEAGRKAEGMVARGEVKGISVGYKVTRWEITKEADENSKYDTWRATGWELLEVSLVPVPADAGAGVRSAGKSTPHEDGHAATQEEDEMIRSENSGAAPAAPESTPAQSAPASAPAQRSEPATPPAQTQQPAGEQRTHARLTASEALGLVETARSFGSDVETRARELITENEEDKRSPDGVRSAILAAAGEAQGNRTSGVRAGSSVTITDDETEKFARGAANAILRRAGMTEMVEQAAKKRGETVDLNPGEFRGMRLVDIAAMTNERNGIRPASRSPEDIVRAALEGHGQRGISPQGLQGIDDFPVILGNVIRQTLQAAYATVPDTWRRFCAVGSVQDFRPHYRVRLSTFGSLQTVNEKGEYKNQEIPDGSREAITAQTKGLIIALTRQAIINDDLSAFSTLAVQLGRIAARTIEEDVYATLALNSGLGPVMADGSTLFHADHGNISTGAAISVAALDADDQLMAAQKDRGGKEYLDLSPSVLLVPRGLRSEAIKLNGAEYDPNTSGRSGVPNVVRGLFDDIVASPRLSGKRRYIFADPTIAPALEVAFLNGEQEPFIDQQEGFRVDGIEWKVRHDYGVGSVDYVGAVTNAGA